MAKATQVWELDEKEVIDAIIDKARSFGAGQTGGVTVHFNFDPAGAGVAAVPKVIGAVIEFSQATKGPGRV